MVELAHKRKKKQKFFKKNEQRWRSLKEWMQGWCKSNSKITNDFGAPCVVICQPIRRLVWLQKNHQFLWHERGGKPGAEDQITAQKARRCSLLLNSTCRRGLLQWAPDHQSSSNKKHSTSVLREVNWGSVTIFFVGEKSIGARATGSGRGWRFVRGVPLGMRVFPREVLPAHRTRSILQGEGAERDWLKNLGNRNTQSTDPGSIKWHLGICKQLINPYTVIFHAASAPEHNLLRDYEGGDSLKPYRETLWLWYLCFKHNHPFCQAEVVTWDKWSLNEGVT